MKAPSTIKGTTEAVRDTSSQNSKPVRSEALSEYRYLLVLVRAIPVRIPSPFSHPLDGELLIETSKGIFACDAALIALLHGAGLRRSEAVSVDFSGYNLGDRRTGDSRGQGAKGSDGHPSLLSPDHATPGNLFRAGARQIPCESLSTHRRAC